MEGILTAPAWKGSGGAGARASDFQVVGVSLPLVLAQIQKQQKETKNQKIPGSGAHTGRDRKGHRGEQGPVTGKPPGSDMDLDAGQEQKRGGKQTRKRQQAQA